jgi:hypothetical protein
MDVDQQQDKDVPHHMDVDTDMGTGMEMDGHEHGLRHDQNNIAKKYYSLWQGSVQNTPRSILRNFDFAKFYFL